MKLQFFSAPAIPAVACALLLSACAPAMQGETGFASANPRNTNNDYAEMTCAELRKTYQKEMSRTLMNGGPEGKSEGQLNTATLLERLKMKGCRIPE